MTVLTVDIGNSAVKLDVWENSRHLFHTSVYDFDEELAVSLQEKYKLDGAVFSSVRGFNVWEYAAFNSIMEVPSMIFPSEPKEDYILPGSYSASVGADRIAACLGAHSLFPDENLLVVDSGTAVTMDLADKKGLFCGGNISLGITGRLNALHEMTALLPRVEMKGEVSDFGYDTSTAIRNGAVNGVVAEIMFSFGQAQKRMDVKRVVLTGGDAPFLLSRLEKLDMDCHYDPFLVGRGLDVDFRRRV